MDEKILIESPFVIKTLKLKRVEFANKIDQDEVAHDEPPHLFLYCVPSSL